MKRLALLLVLSLAAANDSSAAEIFMAGENVTQFVAPTSVDREIHVLGVYQPKDNWTGGFPPEVLALAENDPEQFHDWWVDNVQNNHTPFPATVRVTYDEVEPMEPVTLVLSSYEPVIWNFEIDPAANVEEILVNGYHEQTVNGTGDIPLTIESFVETNEWLSIGHAWPLETGGSDTQSSLISLEDRFNSRITSFTGSYTADDFTIQGSPVGAEIANPTLFAGNLVDGPNADLIYDAATGGVSIDLSDVAANYPFVGDGSIWWSNFDAQRLFVSLANNDGSFNVDALDVRANDASINSHISKVSGSPHRVSVSDWFLRDWDGEQMSFGEILPAGIQTPEELRSYLASAYFSTNLESGEFDLFVINADPPAAIELAQSLCDINGDTQCDTLDIDALGRAVHGGTSAELERADITGDGVVDTADRDAWLTNASRTNGHQGRYLLGDFDLDRDVDAADLTTLAVNWQQSVSGYSQGDINLDGIVDSKDMNILGNNWQSRNDAAKTAAAPVPEPSSAILFALSLLSVGMIRR